MNKYILTEKQAKQVANDTKTDLSNIIQQSIDTYQKGKDCIKTAKDAAAITKFVVQAVKKGKLNKNELARLATAVIKKGVEDRANRGLKQIGDKLKSKLSALPDDAEFKIKLNTDFKNIRPEDLAKSLLDSDFVLSSNDIEVSANRKRVSAKYNKGPAYAQVTQNYKGGSSATVGTEFAFEAKNKNSMNLIVENWKNFLTEAPTIPPGCKVNINCKCIDRTFLSDSQVTLAEVQTWLYKNGFSKYLKITFKTGSADGKCGDETRSALMAFQKQKQLKKCDACVGPETWGAMQNAGFKPKGSTGPIKEPEQKKEESKDIKISKISEGVYFVGTLNSQSDKITLHFTSAGRDPISVANLFLQNYKNYINNQGNIIVSQYGKQYWQPTVSFLDKNFQNKSVRVIGFGRGAREGGAIDYLNNYKKDSDELILLDPVLPRNIRGFRLPKVSKILVYYGSQFLKSQGMLKRWKTLKQRFIREPGYNSIFITDSTAKKEGMSGHLHYFRSFYENPGKYLNASIKLKSNAQKK